LRCSHLVEFPRSISLFAALALSFWLGCSAAPETASPADGEAPGGGASDDASGGGDPGAGAALFDPARLHVIDITVAQEHLGTLAAGGETRVPAQVAVDGVVHDQVGVRLKGGDGAHRDFDGKAGFSLKFDEFVEQDVQGINKLSLGNSVQDASFVAEHLAYEVFRSVGIPAPRTALARVTVNGELFGLYVMREAYNKRFLARHFSDSRGNLYEGEYLRDVSEPELLDLRTNTRAADRSDLQALAQAVLGGGSLNAVAAHVDLEQFFRFWAAEAVIHHWDGYAVVGLVDDCCSPNNYYVYRDPARQRFVFLPHGADQTFGETHDDAFQLAVAIERAPHAEAVFAARLYAQPEARTRLRQAVAEVLAAWQVDALVQRAEQVAALVRSAGLGGREEFSIGDFEEKLADRLRFVRERPARVRSELGLP
jgi:hypothetical protein